MSYFLDSFPKLNSKTPRRDYDEIKFADFVLRTNEKDCWFLTKSNHVLKLISTAPNKDLMCQKIKTLDEFYPHTLKSSFLNIFEAEYELESLAPCSISDIKSKLVAVRSSETAYVFFPLLHSYQEI